MKVFYIIMNMTIYIYERCYRKKKIEEKVGKARKYEKKNVIKISSNLR